MVIFGLRSEEAISKQTDGRRALGTEGQLVQRPGGRTDYGKYKNLKVSECGAWHDVMGDILGIPHSPSHLEVCALAVPGTNLPLS